MTRLIPAGSEVQELILAAIVLVFLRTNGIHKAVLEGLQTIATNKKLSKHISKVRCLLPPAVDINPELNLIASARGRRLEPCRGIGSPTRKHAKPNSESTVCRNC